MGNSERFSTNTSREQNNRNESNTSWTEVASGVADLCSKLSSSSTGTLPNSDSRLVAVPSSSLSASAGGSDSVAGWQFPEKGWVNCNVAGSFLPNKRSASCGGVYRDTQGNWLYGFSRKLVCRSLIRAEIVAIYVGLKVAWERGYRKLIIETDSIAAVNHVYKGVRASHNLAVPVYLAREYLNKDWEKIKIVYLSGDYNEVADKLAALSHDESHDLLVGGLKHYYYAPDTCSKFHSDEVSRANSLPRSNDSYSWTEIAAGAAVIAGGLFSVLSSSSSVLVPNSDPDFGGVPPSSSSDSARGSDSIFGWQLPPVGWVKCNVDGSFLREKESAGCGGVYRDAQGKWLYGFAKKLDCCDATTAEINAIYTGLKVARDLGCKKLIIESDSNTAVDFVNKGCSRFHRLAEAVDEARNYVINKDWEVKIVHIPRHCNKVADKLADESHKFMDGVLKKYKDCPYSCCSSTGMICLGKTVFPVPVPCTVACKCGNCAMAFRPR